MDTGDYVIVLSFMAFLSLLAFLAFQPKQNVQQAQPTYVEIPQSLVRR